MDKRELELSKNPGAFASQVELAGLRVCHKEPPRRPKQTKPKLHPGPTKKLDLKKRDDLGSPPFHKRQAILILASLGSAHASSIRPRVLGRPGLQPPTRGVADPATGS